MYGSIIINDRIEDSIKRLASYKSQLARKGNIFVLVRNEINELGDVSHDFFDVIAEAGRIGYIYINTIVVPTVQKTGYVLPDNVMYVVWLALDKQHYFNKDSIREKHIWKDVEWGKRAKNYNPKGKDPGNVWIPTIDDGKAHITKHILLDLSDIVNRIYKCSSIDGLETLYVGRQETTLLHLDSHIKMEHVYNERLEKNEMLSSYISPVNVKPHKVWGKVLWGTSEDMAKVQDESVNVIITSPPYWDLKDYFKKGQIGQEPYDIYLNRLYKVLKECFQKLTHNGSLWLNINIRIKEGKVILIPRDLIVLCKKIGFHYKGVLIWHKSSGIPTHNRNVVDRHEYVLIFSKSIALNINNRILEYGDYKNEKINGGLFWNINRKAGSVGKHFVHPAIYPNELVSRIIEMSTEQNDTVLDPFLGSGTTLIASILNSRNCIGFEYNEGFKPLVFSRINKEISIPFNLI